MLSYDMLLFSMIRYCDESADVLVRELTLFFIVVGSC